MRGRRGLALLLGAIGLVLIVLVILVVLLQSNQTAVPPPIDPEPPPISNGTPGAEEPFVPAVTVDPQAQLIPVVVSLQTIQRGFQISEGELTVDMRLATDVGPNVITRPEDAIGLYARTDIVQGETLTVDNLARDPRLIALDNTGPSSLVPQGWLAMAVPMDRLSSVAYGVAAGDSVDIMLSFTLLRIDDQFQTVLQNSATFITEIRTEEGITRIIYVIDPYGRFEQLPNNDLAHVFPSEDQRPVAVSMVVQNARVIQVGAWTPPAAAQPPTPTPDPDAPTPTPSGIPPTPTPPPPAVLVVALPPQQQLVLKWALESDADIDFALRGVNDGQIYAVENVELDYVLRQFNIQVPPNFTYTVLSVATPMPDEGP